jgi:PAS domain S-box-containing protein
VKIASQLLLLVGALALLITLDAWHTENAARERQRRAQERYNLHVRDDELVRALTEGLAELDALAGAAELPTAATWTAHVARGEAIGGALQRALARGREASRYAAALAAVQQELDGFTRVWRRYADFDPANAPAAAAFRLRELLPLVRERLRPATEALFAAVRQTQLTDSAAELVASERARVVDLSFTAVLIAAMLGAAWHAHRLIIRPLRRMERDARAVSAGRQTNVRFRYDRGDELGAIARAFNDALDTLHSTSFSRAELERLVAERSAQLARSHRQLQRVVEAGGQGFWDWDVAAGRVVFSGHWASMLGYRLDEIEHSLETWKSLVHPDDLPDALRALHAHLDGTAPHYEVEHRLRTAGGEWKWVLTRGVIVERDASGRATRVSGTHTDVHARRATADELRRREEQLRQLADNFPEGALYQFVAPRDGPARTTYIGDGFRRIFGVESVAPFVDADSLAPFVLAEDMPAFRAATERALQSQQPFRHELRIRTAAGETKWLSFRAHPRAERDGETIWDGVMIDITRQKHAELTVAQQVDFFAALNDTAIDLLNRREKGALLQAIVERTSGLLDTPHVELALIEEGTLVTRAYAGQAKNILGDRVTREQARLSWRAIDERQPIIVEDYPGRPEARDLYRALQARAVGVFPILHGSECLGILGLVRHRPGHTFNLDDLQKGQLLAQLVALVLHNSTIYEDAVRVAEARTAALRESEWRLREAQRIAHIGHWEYSFAPGNKIERWSDETYRIFGLEPQSVAIDRAVFDRLIHPDDLAAFRAVIADVWNQPRRVELDYRIVRADGSVRHIHDEGEPKRDETGRVIGMQGIVQDVTERAAADAALREREERFRSVFDRSPIPIVLSRFPEGDIVAANAAAERVSGYTLAEATGRASHELGMWADPEDRRRLLALLAEKGSVTGHAIRIRTRAGEELDMLFSASLVTLGGLRYALSSMIDVTAQKRAEDSLRASELRFKRVVENIGDALVVDDVEGRIVFANDRCLELFRLNRADLAQRTIFDLIAPDSVESIRAMHTARMAGHAVPTLFETEALRGDGSRFWVELRVTPIAEHGGIVGSQAALRDVTERRLIDRTLRLLSTGTAQLSGERFFHYVAQRLAELLGLEIGYIATFTPGPEVAVRTLGLSVDGQPEEHHRPLEPETLAAAVLRERVAVFAASAPQAFPRDELLRRFGVAGVAAVPLLGNSGDIIGLAGVFSRQEIPRLGLVESVLQLAAVRLAAEVARMRNERQFQDLFEFAPDAIIMLDAARRIVRTNHRAEELFGFEAAELAGQPLARLFSETDLGALEKAIPARDDQAAAQVNVSAQRRDGTVFGAQVSLGVVGTDSGMLVAAAIRDISQQQLAESHLRQRQKIEALGTLAGGIAHDFNNILTGMFGFVELTRADLPPGHPAAQWLENIAAAARRARNLVQQILTFSRQNEGAREPVDVAAVAAEALRLLRSTLPPMVHIEQRFAPDAPRVLADPTQLHQVVMNLGTNAWHALPDSRGTITVAVEGVIVSDDDAAAHPDLPRGRAVKLSVADDGAGIPAAVMERIFDPFFTTKPAGQGTGLGLAVVHGVVRAHGGAILVHSVPNEGTRFEIFLPAIEAAVPAESARPPVPHGSGERILLVDDEHLGRTALAALLEHLGYRVDHFEHPEVAITHFAAQASRYAAVITDFAMPGMTGTAVARQVRSIRPDMPVLLVTGYIDPHRQAELERAGVTMLLRKPPTIEELAGAVARCVRAEAQPAQPR